jgi:cathepsin D
LQGATLISGTPNVVEEFYNQIPGSQALDDGYYTFPCDDELPEIVFYFGGVAFPITQSFNTGLEDEGSPNCIGAIRGDQQGNSWTMGTAFMTNYYTIFDVGNQRVGFATLA